MRLAAPTFAVLLVVIAPAITRSQDTGPAVGKYLSMIENGQGDLVRSELPSLMTRYPNNPGVLYIQGLLTRDGAEAVRVYQSIVDNFPKSEWAADALYKVYQFYYALGLYRTAELKMAQLRRDYPSSRHVTRSTDVETSGLAEEKGRSLMSPGDSVSPPSQTEQPPVILPPEREGAIATGAVVPVQGGGQFALQVGAYSSQENAEKQKVFFENLQFPVELNTKVKSGKSLYIVMIGSFGSYDEAKAKGVDIKKRYNIDSIVVAK